MATTKKSLTFVAKEFTTLLGRHWKGQGASLLIAVVLAALSSAGSLVLPLAARDAIDGLTSDSRTWTPLFQLSALVLLSALASGANSMVLGAIGQRVLLTLRLELFGTVLRSQVVSIERRLPGDIISRATSDVAALQQAVSHAPIQAINASIGLLGGALLMILLSPQLFLIVAVVLVLDGLMLRYVLPRISSASIRYQESIGQLTAGLDRVVGSFRLVKASGREQYELHKLQDVATSVHASGMYSVRWTSIFSMASGLSQQISFLAVLGVGGFLVASDELDVATLVAFLLYVFYIMGPIGDLAASAQSLSEGIGAGHRLQDLQTLPAEDYTLGPNSPEPEHLSLPAHPAPPPEGPPPSPWSVDFQDVSFAYAERSPVLEGVTFSAAPGSRTAIVGSTGSGKSTIFALLLRFFDCSGGRVLVNNVPIEHFPVRSLRQGIGYVDQDCSTLEGSLLENLIYSSSMYERTSLEALLREVRLDDLVARLPSGLESNIGARGASLSGGERQRVALARAILRRPRLLLLDEVTSHLDPETETALTRLLSGIAWCPQETSPREALSYEPTLRSTVIVVAHRVATMRSADQILLLEHGKVAASGTFDDLMNSNSRFQHLVRSAEEAVAPGELA